MQINVLYINAIADIAGGELSFYSVLRTLDRAVINPIVVLPCKGSLYYLLREIDVETILMPLNRLDKRNPFSVFPYFLTVYRLIKIIKRRRIQIIHLNMSNTSQFGAVAGKLAGIPTICHMRNPSLSKVAFERDMLFLPDLFIAISKAAEEGYKKFLKRHQNSRVLYNSIVLDDFDRADGRKDFRQKYGLDQDVFLIGCVAQMDPRKGQYVLLKAVAQLIDARPRIHLFLAGSVKPFGVLEYLDRLRGMVKEYGISDKVTFGGFVTDLVSMYRSFDLVVLPTLWEAFGRVIVEAMAAEKGVICTNVGGIPEIVEDGVTGLLIPPEDPKALAEAILRLVNNPDLLNRFGKNGRERVEKYFSARVNVRQLENIYTHMVRWHD